MAETAFERLQKRQAEIQAKTAPTGGNTPAPEAGFLTKLLGASGVENLDAAAAGVAKGLMLGFNDEIGAGLQSMFSDQTYDERLSAIRGHHKKLAEDNPYVSIGGEIVGGVAPTLLGGGAAALGAKGIGMLGKAATAKKVADLGKGATTATGMLGRAAAGGALSGGAYGFGEGEGSAGERAKNAVNNAMFGGVFGAAGHGVVTGGRRLASAAGKGLRPSVNTLQKVKNQAYKDVDAANIRFSPQDGMRLNNNLKRLAARDVRYSVEEDSATRAVFTNIDKLIKRKDKGLSLQELDDVRSNAMARLAKNPDQVVLHDIVDELDDLIETSGPANDLMLKARAANKVYKKSELLDLAMQNAKDTASAQDRRDSLGIMKTAIKNIKNNPRKSKWFNEAELGSMQKIVDGTVGEKALRKLGEVRPTTNGIIQVMLIAGLSPYGPAAAGLAGTAYAAGAGARQLAKGKVESLLDEVAGMGPRVTKIPLTPGVTSAAGNLAQSGQLPNLMQMAEEQGQMPQSAVLPAFSEYLKQQGGQ